MIFSGGGYFRLIPYNAIKKLTWQNESFSNKTFLLNLYIPEGYFLNMKFTNGLIFIILGFTIVLILEFFSKKNATKK